MLQSNSSSVVLRVSLFDPAFSMPSQSSFQIEVNFPPTGGSLVVNPAEGVQSSTRFSVTLSGWQDQDTPVQYLVAYYLSPALYESDVASQSVESGQHGNYLAARSTRNSISTVLPRPNGENNAQSEILIVAFVSDSLGATNTVTQTVRVLDSNLTVNETFTKYES